MVFPETDKQLWQASQDWLTPHSWEPDSDNMLVATQSWVIRSAERIILVDTDVGNNKDRPGMAMFDHRSTNYLDNLAQAGVTPTMLTSSSARTCTGTPSAGTLPTPLGSGYRPSPTPATCCRGPTSSTGILPTRIART